MKAMIFFVVIDGSINEKLIKLLNEIDNVVV